MEFDLSGIIPPPAPANDDADLSRIVGLMTGMQEGMDRFTEILARQQARLEVLEIEVRRLKARTDAPARPSILRVN